MLGDLQAQMSSLQGLASDLQGVARDLHGEKEKVRSPQGRCRDAGRVGHGGGS